MKNIIIGKVQGLLICEWHICIALILNCKVAFLGVAMGYMKDEQKKSLTSSRIFRNNRRGLFKAAASQKIFK